MKRIILVIFEIIVNLIFRVVILPFIWGMIVIRAMKDLIFATVEFLFFGGEMIFYEKHTRKNIADLMSKFNTISSEDQREIHHGKIWDAPLGIYTIHWESGGTSIGSIYQTRSGVRMIAPCNWTSPGCMCDVGKMIKKLTLIKEK